MKVIDDILEISKLGTKQVKVRNEDVNLNNLLRHLFSIFDIKTKENKIPLYLEKGLPDNESTIQTDPNKLNKILSNLIENAIKFTKSGFIEFGYKLDGDQIVLYVQDTGIGINKEKQEFIFERFSQEEEDLTVNQGGLGLGLSIAKENTMLLGGQISVQSEKGKGSTFYVTIPYLPSQTIDSKTTNKNRNSKKTFTVLIAEDEEVNYLYLVELLERRKDFKFQTIHAKNGKEAVDNCKTNPKIDLVLMDIRMPIMDGYEATRRIKEIRKDLPIIAQTSFSTEEDKDMALSIGCDEFISKPITSANLKIKINQFLEN